MNKDNDIAVINYIKHNTKIVKNDFLWIMVFLVFCVLGFQTIVAYSNNRNQALQYVIGISLSALIVAIIGSAVSRKDIFILCGAIESSCLSVQLIVLASITISDSNTVSKPIIVAGAVLSIISGILFCMLDRRKIRRDYYGKMNKEFDKGTAGTTLSLFVTASIIVRILAKTFSYDTMTMLMVLILLLSGVFIAGSAVSMYQCFYYMKKYKVK